MFSFKPTDTMTGFCKSILISLTAWAVIAAFVIALTGCTATFGPSGLQSISIDGSEVARAIIIHATK